ncbi:hypothetical protein NEMBOFW57_003578 [Staphylotrichum longicolle]|uniref:Uncharacterized protein n=1 Tax=Staphylotrichum longicolle TaxID=669026 RepID=A0AAD4F5R7_9PEZI|nr:hypothetical protein NEMBOFW57_003578 [Staphylotrichum longicolle]
MNNDEFEPIGLAAREASPKLSQKSPAAAQSAALAVPERLRKSAAVVQSVAPEVLEPRRSPLILDDEDEPMPDWGIDRQNRGAEARDNDPYELEDERANGNGNGREDHERRGANREWYSGVRDSLTADEFSAMIPQVTDASWSAAKKERLAGEWSTHPVKRAAEERCFVMTADCPETVLWWNTARYMGCLPPNIISRDHNMVFEYEPLTYVKLEREVPALNTLDQARRALWSKTFCTALGDVLSHPSWEGEPRLLRAAIQYAVICATDDRRLWDPDCVSDSVFFNMFVQETRKNRTGRKLSDIHVEVLSLVKQRQDTEMRPWWSRLFHALEAEARDNCQDTRDAGLSVLPPDTKPYIVRTSDLHRLASAIQTADRLHNPGIDWIVPRLSRQRKAFRTHALAMMVANASADGGSVAATSDGSGSSDVDF